jgi:hypothetical protein
MMGYKQQEIGVLKVPKEAKLAKNLWGSSFNIGH